MLQRWNSMPYIVDDLSIVAVYMYSLFLLLSSLYFFPIFWTFTFTLQVMNLIGDVKGKVAVMVDDMIDTAGLFLSLFYLHFS